MITGLGKRYYYIGSGYENKMYTLRDYVFYTNGETSSESDRHMLNLSTDYEEAYKKAKIYAERDDVTLRASKVDNFAPLDPIIRKRKRSAEEIEKAKIDLQIAVDDFLQANPILAQNFETYGDADIEVQRDIGFAFYDIKDKLYKYGNLSEAQVDFCLKMVDSYITRKENAKVWAEEKADAEPVPVTEERIQFTGEVIKTAWKDYTLPNGMPTSSQKCTVKDDRGFVVWGGNVGEKGDRVTFMAKVTVSDNDPKFGFYKRPTKIQKIEKAGVENNG